MKIQIIYFITSIIALCINSCTSDSVASSARISKDASKSLEELILRVRLPDGSVRKTPVLLSDTINDICDKLECDNESGVSTDSNFENCIDCDLSVKELNLEHGSWLFVKKNPRTKAADNSKAIRRMRKQRERISKGSGVVECNSMQKLNNELKEAGNSLVIIDFYADWCGPCKNIAPKYKAMADEYTKAVFLKVNVDSNREASEQYNVSSMPTFVFVKKGKVVDTLKGADEASLRSKIKSYM